MPVSGFRKDAESGLFRHVGGNMGSTFKYGWLDMGTWALKAYSRQKRILEEAPTRRH